MAICDVAEPPVLYKANTTINLDNGKRTLKYLTVDYLRLASPTNRDVFFSKHACTAAG